MIRYLKDLTKLYFIVWKLMLIGLGQVISEMNKERKKFYLYAKRSIKMAKEEKDEIKENIICSIVLLILLAIILAVATPRLLGH